ncbi:hypothetical protein V3C99_010966, partial [Haemonchus contortus]
MYGFPYCNYDAGKNITDYRCMDRYKTFNDRMEYIFNASQALYPSIYLNNKTDYQRNFRYVQAIMAETLRVARNYSRHLPIYVYTKFEYDPLNQLCSFYTKEDSCSTIVLPYKMGADGLIFWSSSSNMTKRCDIVTKFVNTTLGPLVKKVLNESVEDRRTAYNLTFFVIVLSVTGAFLVPIQKERKRPAVYRTRNPIEEMRRSNRVGFVRQKLSGRTTKPFSPERFNWDYRNFSKIGTFPRKPLKFSGKNSCPDGWLQFKESCYFFEHQKMDQEVAERRCYEQGATLFVANTLEEWNTVLKRSTINFWTWIGLVQMDDMRTPKWQTSGAIQLSKLNWLLSPYQVGSNGWSTFSQCAAHFNSQLKTSSYLYFYPCSLQFASICERNSS